MDGSDPRPRLTMNASLLALNGRKGIAQNLGFSFIDKKKMIDRETTSKNMVLAVQIHKCIFDNIPKKRSISTPRKTCSYLSISKSIGWNYWEIHPYTANPCHSHTEQRKPMVKMVSDAHVWLLRPGVWRSSCAIIQDNFK